MPKIRLNNLLKEIVSGKYLPAVLFLTEDFQKKSEKKTLKKTMRKVPENLSTRMVLTGPNYYEI